MILLTAVDVVQSRTPVRVNTAVSKVIAISSEATEKGFQRFSKPGQIGMIATDQSVIYVQCESQGEAPLQR